LWAQISQFKHKVSEAMEIYVTIKIELRLKLNHFSNGKCPQNFYPRIEMKYIWDYITHVHVPIKSNVGSSVIRKISFKSDKGRELH